MPCVMFPTLEVMTDLIVSLPPQMARYLKDVFGPRVAPLMGMEAEELYRMKISLPPDELGRRLGPALQPLTTTPEAFVDQLDAMGVEKAVIFNLDEASASGIQGLPNDYYADLARAWPQRFVGFAGIDPSGAHGGRPGNPPMLRPGASGGGLEAVYLRSGAEPCQNVPDLRHLCGTGDSHLVPSVHQLFNQHHGGWNGPSTWTWWPRIFPS